MLAEFIVVTTLGLGLPQDTVLPFRWTGTLPPGATLEVRGIIGTIRAEPARGREISVEASRKGGRHGAPGNVEIRVFQDSARVLICAVYPRDEWDGHRDRSRPRDPCEAARQNAVRRGQNDTRVDYLVKVPSGVRFIGETVTDDVIVVGLRGPAEGYSIAGDVTMRDIRGAVLDAASISGDLTFQQVDAPEVYAGTLSGDVSFDGAIHRRGDYELFSHTGGIAVTLPRNAGVEVEVHASHKDDLHSSVPLVRSAESRRRYAGKQGDGSARMDLTSFGGDIRISASDR